MPKQTKTVSLRLLLSVLAEYVIHPAYVELKIIKAASKKPEKTLSYKISK